MDPRERAQARARQLAALAAYLNLPASPILVGGISHPGKIWRLESRSLDLVGQNVAQESCM